jgi:nitrite reductase/ring-hydroxylating ferredoxin subunit
MPERQWTDIGSVEELQREPLQEIQCGKTHIALTYKNGKFAALSGVCNHVGGPLGKGRLTTTISSAHGTTGSFTVKLDRESQGTR